MPACVDKKKCIGCGLCAEICDEVFTMEKDGKAGVKKKTNSKEISKIKDAIECCPVDAISE